MSVDKFIDDSMGDDGDGMTPAQAAQALEMAMSNGDTAQADSIDTPADTATDHQSDHRSDPSNESNAVLLARDGVHTIPFEQLTNSREQTRLAQEAEQAARAELEALKQQYQSQGNGVADPNQQDQAAETAQAAIDAGVDPSIFGDFDEEGIAAGIEKLIAQRLQSVLAPIEQQKQDTAIKSHWDTIFDAHNDADSVVGSVEFDSWRQSQPSYANAAIDTVLERGTAQEIVELLDTFKQSTNSGSPASSMTAKDRAQQVINNTKQSAPISLSDMPGHPGATSIGEQVKSMSGVDALDVMANWSQEQINQHLNSL